MIGGQTMMSGQMTRRSGRWVFSHMFKYARPYWFAFAISVFLLSADITLQVGLAWVQQLFIDTINRADLIALGNIVIVCGSASVAIVVCYMIKYYYRNYVQTSMVRDLSERVFNATNRLKFQSVLSMHSGDLASRNNRDVDLSMGIVGRVVYDLGYNLLLCAVAFIYLFRMHALLSILAIGCGPIVFAAGRLFDRQLRRLSERVQRQEAIVRALLQETLQGIKVVRAFALEDDMLDRFVAEREKLNVMLRKRTLLNGLVWQSSSLVNGTVVIICAGVIGYAAIQGSMSPGQVLAFLILMGRVQWPFVGMSQTWGGVQESLGAADRVFDLLELPGEVSKQEPEVLFGKNTAEDVEAEFAAADADASPAALSLRGVRLSHKPLDGGEPTLLFDGLDLDVAPGETVAIVGPSGSGKTSLARLCCGLYEADAGDIVVCGTQLTPERLDEARRHMTYVPQTPYLFAGTIRDNIAFGTDDASDADISEAAELAGAARFIERMPLGRDTPVGEHGSALSGGQRQRIALARAFLRKSPLLILDEATSALDNESEQLIQHSIEMLAQGRTTIVIAHRLSTVRIATRIIVMDYGRIAEQGTHEELLAQDGMYAQLYRIQFRDEVYTAS